jgi:hypothetical protein
VVRNYVLPVNYHAFSVLSMERICEICKSSEPLLEFNKMLACAACVKGMIQRITREVTRVADL